MSGRRPRTSDMPGGVTSARRALMLTLAQLEASALLVHGALAPTPAYAWPLLAQRAGAEVWVKHENHLPTGAFKVRGGVTYFDRLRGSGRAGVIFATRGNHGQSLAWAGRRAGVPVTIVVPHGNSVEKNAAMAAFGARLVEHGDDFEAARSEAMRLSTAEGLEFAPSFHVDLVIGVATYSLELFRAAPPLDTLYVPIGMGSGICGAVLTRDLLGLGTEIVGVQSVGRTLMPARSRAGHVVMNNRSDTEADGIATRAAGRGGVCDHSAWRSAHRHGRRRRDRRRCPRLLDRYAQSRGGRGRRAARRAASGKATDARQARWPGAVGRQHRPCAVPPLGTGR